MFWTQLLTLPFDFIGGSFHDLFGRKLTIFFGLVIGALSVAVQPWLTTIYPGVLITKLILSIGLAGPSATPLVADYVKNRSRGLASAYKGLSAGIGVIFGMFVLFSLTNEMSYKESYAIAAGVTILLAFFLLFGVKNTKYHKKHVETMTMQEKMQLIY